MGARNAMNSWDRGDSMYCDHICIDCEYVDYDDCDDVRLGENDYSLAKRLVKAGTDHRKFMRMLPVYIDITAPLYWWKEYDTYKVGTVANSCSTMHKIHEKRFGREDFSIEHLENCIEEHWMMCMDNVITSLNIAREKYLETNDKKHWWQMIQLLPSSYNQMRTVVLNYEVLANIYKSRKNHKLDEWHDFCWWIKTLPYSELITGEFEEDMTEPEDSIEENKPVKTIETIDANELEDDDDDERYILTPKGVAVIDLYKCGLIEDIDDKRGELFYHEFIEGLKRLGYLEEKGSE